MERWEELSAGITKALETGLTTHQVQRSKVMNIRYLARHYINVHLLTVSPLTTAEPGSGSD